jgi:hypothetical protein
MPIMASFCGKRTYEASAESMLPANPMPCLSATIGARLAATPLIRTGAMDEV